MEITTQMPIYKKIESIVNDSNIIVKYEPKIVSYKKCAFEIIHYDCESKEDDPNLESIKNEFQVMNDIQAENQYREQNRIPFVEEIVGIRQKYGISARKMSEVLALGVNVYKLYENGDMPSVSNGRLILSVAEPNMFIYHLKLSGDRLDKNDIAVLSARAVRLKELEDVDFKHYLVNNMLPLYNHPNRYNGYRLFDEDRIVAAMQYINGDGYMSKIVMARVFFYLDAWHYRVFGCSFTGLAYIATQDTGIVADKVNLIDEILLSKGLARTREVIIDGVYDDVVSVVDKSSIKILSEDDRWILNKVLKLFRGKGSLEIIEYCMREPLWKELRESGGMVDYQTHLHKLPGIIL